jgi:RNA polymerase sigma-70 factor (ECF subfamily)
MSDAISHVHHQLTALYPDLLRFASFALRNKERAEDAVQETMLSALENPGNFCGKSTFRTYVTGILRFKILDTFRLLEKEMQLPSDENYSDTDIIDDLITTRVNFSDLERAEITPDMALSQKEFFGALEISLNKLPQKMARVFLMREYLGFETEEICIELGLTKANLWTLLFRARQKLRKFLNLECFGLYA